MNRNLPAKQSRIGRTIASVVFGGLVVAALAGCHVDPVDSSTGGGSVAAAPKAPPAGASNSGSVKPANNPKPATNTPTGGLSVSCTPFPGGTGMVYKPHSEANGNLVVLLVSSAAETTGAAMADRTGKIIERIGNGPRTNGNRPTYRFSRPGSAFPSPGILIVGSQRYCIPNTGSRYS